MVTIRKGVCVCVGGGANKRENLLYKEVGVRTEKTSTIMEAS